MLWSLTKILLFVAAIAGLTLGAGYLMESDGGVMLTVAGVEYTLSPLMSVIALGVLLVVLWV
ncbi:MAG: heme biosynthesis protein HemY, partial [Cognatishimia sp.]|nr:heme biosynthesis protein HemY [Cognatishimia sp.]